MPLINKKTVVKGAIDRNKLLEHLETSKDQKIERCSQIQQLYHHPFNHKEMFPR